MFQSHRLLLFTYLESTTIICYFVLLLQHQAEKKTQLKRIEREKNKVSFSDLTITDAISRKRKNDEKFCENVDEVFFFRKNFVPITIRSFSVYFHFTIFIFISSLFCLFGFCLLICIITSKKVILLLMRHFFRERKKFEILFLL